MSTQEYASLMEEKEYQVSFRIVEEIQNLIRYPEVKFKETVDCTLENCVL